MRSWAFKTDVSFFLLSSDARIPKDFGRTKVFVDMTLGKKLFVCDEVLYAGMCE